jgi:3-hydroxyisobutyrate dehydrogenase
MAKKIGWIGLGHMGLPMATNLKNAGFDIKVWNRTIEKAQKSGIPYTETLEDLVKDRDVIITMLFDSNSVLDVYSKIVKFDIKGKTFIDMTTVHPDTAKKVAEMLITKGGDFLEAPVIGSVIPAQKGTLTIVVSGDENTYKNHLNIFTVLGKQIFYMGDYGVASTMKLINNTVLGSFLNVLCEAIIFAKKAGIDQNLAIKVLENGAGKSMVLDAKKEKLLNEDYSTHFSVALIHKDLTYAIDVANKIGAVSNYSSISREFYNSARANELSQMDFSAVLEIFKKLSNIS